MWRNKFSTVCNIKRPSHLAWIEFYHTQPFMTTFSISPIGSRAPSGWHQIGQNLIDQIGLRNCPYHFSPAATNILRAMLVNNELDEYLMCPIFQIIFMNGSQCL